MLKWSGEGKFFLPARRIEPYRLWFEFLKAAHRDPDISVDEEYYADWGNYKEQTFNQWWTKEKFLELFAVDTEVRVLNSDEAVKNNCTCITIRLPLSRDPKETLKDVKELLEQHGATELMRDAPQGKFSLTKGFESGLFKTFGITRYVLRIYNAWLDYPDLPEQQRLLKTAETVIDWTNKRKADLDRRVTKDKNYPYSHAPVEAFVKDVRAGGSGGADGYNKRVLTRYLNTAKKHARGAAIGQFPGK
jgi:hypothetical protein